MIVVGDDGHLLWNGNWISYLDTMLQIQVLSLPGRGLRLPTRIKALRIDPTLHHDKVGEFHGTKGMLDSEYIILTRIHSTLESLLNFTCLLPHTSNMCFPCSHEGDR